MAGNVESDALTMDDFDLEEVFEKYSDECENEFEQVNSDPVIHERASRRRFGPWLLQPLSSSKGEEFTFSIKLEFSDTAASITTILSEDKF